MQSAVTYKANALHSHSGFHCGVLKHFTSISGLSFPPSEERIVSGNYCSVIWLLSLHDRNGVTLDVLKS